ncbi:helix-turn-helix transcriptional regulator [Arcanobacterium canis]
MSNKRTASERRLALLAYLRTTQPTINQIMALPTYADYSPGPTLKRLIARDIADLRKAGHEVSVQGSEYRYVLNTTGAIDITGTGAELGVLRDFLDHRSLSMPGETAQSGLYKLLAEGHNSGPSGVYTASVPTGDEAPRIAHAISQGKSIAFIYDSTHGQRRYVLDPWQITINFGAFYVRGKVIQIGSKTASGVKIFKVDRIVGEVIVTENAITSQPIAVEDAFSLIDAVVDVKAGTCTPLYARATEATDPSPHKGWDRLDLRQISRDELFELLIFYGVDIQLVGPEAIRDDFVARLRHAVEVSQ